SGLARPHSLRVRVVARPPKSLRGRPADPPSAPSARRMNTGGRAASLAQTQGVPAQMNRGLRRMRVRPERPRSGAREPNPADLRRELSRLASGSEIRGHADPAKSDSVAAA